ncbi:hypothetical protein LSCM4_07764 [Leishmania orientalis]|uniref:Uncharacterized protein n=1 Tax=Leishmania orientalis TaxID=2249476 RepID=A0A836HNB1_9TRYP|nr:hypothetical protein LSCM4_07764 [Leishmania orientalis]
MDSVFAHLSPFLFRVDQDDLDASDGAASVTEVKPLPHWLSSLAPRGEGATERSDPAAQTAKARCDGRGVDRVKRHRLDMTALMSVSAGNRYSGAARATFLPSGVMCVVWRRSLKERGVVFLGVSAAEARRDATAVDGRMANAHDTKLHRPKAPSSSVMNTYVDMTDRISCEEDMLMEGQIVDDKSGGGEVDEGYFGDVASAFGGGAFWRGGGASHQLASRSAGGGSAHQPRRRHSDDDHVRLFYHDVAVADAEEIHEGGGGRSEWRRRRPRPRG